MLYTLMSCRLYLGLSFKNTCIVQLIPEDPHKSNTHRKQFLLSTPVRMHGVRMHGGLLCIAFCLWPLDQNPRLENNSYLAKYSSWKHENCKLKVCKLSACKSDLLVASFQVIMAGAVTSTSSCIFYQTGVTLG